MLYFYFKAIHIVFIVSWMAGLFYIVRLVIYHTEATKKSEIEQKILIPQFTLMESRLWNIITTPAMILSILAGLGMIVLNPLILEMDWFLLKLLFVFFLIIYHFICQNILRQVRNNIFKLTSTQLRIWNEVATLLLVAIVFTVVLKNTMDWILGVIGLLGLGSVMMIAIQLYKKRREK